MARDRDVRAFDERAASYEAGRHGQLHKEISNRVVALALRQAPVPRRVLDVGCGTGYVLRELAARLPGTVEFLGVDPAPGMIEVAVERLTRAGAIVVREDIQDGVPDHFVMTDPEGNEFCVL